MKSAVMCFVVLLTVTLGHGQEVSVIERYVGAIYTHEVTIDGFETAKSINPRVGLNVRFPLAGSLYTRIVYDLPDKPFGHIIWEVPIQESGWSGIRLQTGYLPRLAALIKPTPLSIDGHNETAAMGSAPGATYALRVAVSDSAGSGIRSRVFVGAYQDVAKNLGYETAVQLLVGESKVGLSQFLDSRVVGASLFFDTPDVMGFMMLRFDRHFVAEDIAGSVQTIGTLLGDPYIDVVYSASEHAVLVSELGTFVNFDVTDLYKSQLGAGYDFAEGVAKAYVAFYW